MIKTVIICEKCNGRIEALTWKSYVVVKRSCGTSPPVEIIWCKCGNTGVMVFKEEENVS